MASLVARIVSRSTNKGVLVAVLLLVLIAASGFTQKRTSAEASVQPSVFVGTPKQQSVLPFYSDATFTAEWVSPRSMRYDRLHTIAPFALVNQTGMRITNQSLAGKIYIANFFFTTCQGICPKMLKNLHRISQAFEKDPRVVLVSHTVMPQVDSQEVLLAYAEANRIPKGRWHLLFGDKDEIYRLARQSYFAEKSLGVRGGKTGDFLHTENMLLVDGEGHLRGVYNATLPLEADRAVADIEELLAEAGPVPRVH